MFHAVSDQIFSETSFFLLSLDGTGYVVAVLKALELSTTNLHF